MVLISLESGEVVNSTLRPSSDTPTHLALYRAFTCGAIVHTHSQYATMFAQSRTPIGCMGTTHADYFRGDIPVTRAMTQPEVATNYEANTGAVIVEAFRVANISPEEVPGGARREPCAVHVEAGCGEGDRECPHPGVRGANGLARASHGAGCAAAGSVPDQQALPSQTRQDRVLRTEMIIRSVAPPSDRHSQRATPADSTRRMQRRSAGSASGTTSTDRRW